MDFAKLFQALEAGLKTATDLSEAAEALGVPSQVADAMKIATVLIGTINNVKRLIEDGKIVASSGDQARIDAIMSDLSRRNDELAAKIAAS